jgi:hypothetical protein
MPDPMSPDERARITFSTMANRRRKPGTSGRVTPRAGAESRPSRPGRFDFDTPSEIGRRPSSPAFLLVVALMWIAVGIIAIASLSAWWKFVPGILFVGIGLLFLRGASATVVRRDRRQSDE